MDSNTLTAIDFLELEFGGLPEDKRKLIESVLEFFMAEARKLIDPEAEPGKACTESGPRCGSCAFNPSMDGTPDFTPTAFGIVRSIREGLPFICHRNQPRWRENIIDRRNLLVCEGFKAVTENHPEKLRDLTAATLAFIEVISGRA